MVQECEAVGHSASAARKQRPREAGALSWPPFPLCVQS